MTGQGTATLCLGSPLFPKLATTTGAHVVDYAVGTTVPVWINPISQAELSFSPRATDGGQKYWLVALAGALALGGVGALVVGREWIEVEPLAPPNSVLARPEVADKVVPSVSTADRLHAIDWFQFEAVAARVLEAEGWAVERSGGAKPDGGADMLATRNGRKAVVQCKHWRRVEVQPKIIRELLGTKASTRFAADEAILVTLSDCTDAALACARENSVVIYNAGAVEAAIERVGLDRFPELTNPDRKLCPKCGAAMVFREKAATPFWGCSTFPRCRGTIERA